MQEAQTLSCLNQRDLEGRIVLCHKISLNKNQNWLPILKASGSAPSKLKVKCQTFLVAKVFLATVQNKKAHQLFFT